MTEEELDNQEIQIVTLQDEDGQDQDFEIIDEMEYEGAKYYALLPYYDKVEDLDSKSEDEDTEILVMRGGMDGDDEVFETIDDDDLFEKVTAIFDARLDEAEAQYGDGDEPAEEM